MFSPLRCAAGLFLAVVPLLGSACREPGERETDAAYKARHVFAADAAPAPRLAVGAKLGALTYLGMDTSAAEVEPGQSLTIVHLWRADAAPGAGLKFFTHVEGEGGGRLNADESRMRRVFPLAEWVAGQVVRDEQTLAVPKDWQGSNVEILVGLYRPAVKGNAARVVATGGEVDAQGRLIAARLPVRGRVPETPRVYHAPRAVVTPVLDGKADDAVWRVAAPSEPFTDALGGRAVGQATVVRMAWDAQNLYVFADVTDRDVASQFLKADDPLWKEDCVELFIDADGSRSAYGELQVSPRNVVFDSWFGTTRQGGGDVTWQSGMRTAVQVEGTLDNREDEDTGWTVEMAIPWEAVRGRAPERTFAIPPQAGAQLRLNVVRVEKGKKPKDLRAASWSSIRVQDFHGIDRLGTVVLASDDGKPVVERPPAPGDPQVVDDRPAPGGEPVVDGAAPRDAP